MTGIFPLFDATLNGDPSLEMFEVAQVFNRQTDGNTKVVVSTTLYYGTHTPAKFSPVDPDLERIDRPQPFVRDGRPWSKRYYLPFLQGCMQRLPDGWVRRVHLAANLKFLVNQIPTSVEIYLMKQSSWGAAPGMFWRYLPVEENVFCVVRDSEKYFLDDQTIDVVAEAVRDGTFLVRRVARVWKDDRSRLWYRSVQGNCAVRGPLKYVPHAAAWIAQNRAHLITDDVVDFPGMTHVGLETWDAYGQDEQFLCRWLYYKGAHRKTVGMHFAGTDPDIFLRDQDYYIRAGGEHRYIQIIPPAKQTR